MMYKYSKMKRSPEILDRGTKYTVPDAFNKPRSHFYATNSMLNYSYGGPMMNSIKPLTGGKQFDTPIYRDTTEIPTYRQGGAMGKPWLSNLYPNGGQLYTYAARPEAVYQKDEKGNWYIKLPSTHGQFVPLNDPTGKRAGELEEKAKPYVTAEMVRRTDYGPSAPVPSETTQQVAQNYMMAKDSKEYAERVGEAQRRANIADPMRLYGNMSREQLQGQIDALTPEEKKEVQEMMKEYYDPTREVGEHNYLNPNSFTEALDWRLFSDRKDWNKWATQQWNQNKQKRYANETDAYRAFLAGKMQQKYALLNSSYRPPSAENNYNDSPMQSADWLWTLPFGARTVANLAPSFLNAASIVGRSSLPFMSTVPGATYGNALMSGFIGNSLYETPGNIKDWYDVTQGKKDWREATVNSAEIALGLIGSKPGFTSVADDVAKVLGTDTGLLSKTHVINPFATRLNKYNRVVGQDAIQDMQKSGLVRQTELAGVTDEYGITRQTPYTSFGIGRRPKKAYVDQVLNQGKTPYIISTNRPMAPSTLSNHGFGTTRFPINTAEYDPALRNYLSSFPASEATVFNVKPHWLKGYQKVTGPVGIGPKEVKLMVNPTRSEQLGMQSYDIYQGKTLVGEVSGSTKLNGDFQVMDIGVKPEFQKQGIGTQVYKQLNQQLNEGNKVSSWGAFVENNGVKPGQKTWDALVREGVATQNQKGMYEMFPNTTSKQPLTMAELMAKGDRTGTSMWDLEKFANSRGALMEPLTAEEANLAMQNSDNTFNTYITSNTGFNQNQVGEALNAQQGAFDESTDFGLRWMFKDKAKYQDLLRQHDDLFNQGNSLYSTEANLQKEWQARQGELVDEWLASKGQTMAQLEKDLWNPVDSPLHTKAKTLLTDAMNASLSDAKLAEITAQKNAVQKAQAQLRAQKLGIRTEIEGQLDPTVEQKIDNIYSLAGAGKAPQAYAPDLMKVNDKGRLVYLDRNSQGFSHPSFQGLTAQDQSYIADNFSTIGGVRTADNTITFGSRPWTQQGFKLKTPGSTEYGTQFTGHLTPPTSVGTINAHEIGHDLQKVKNWADLLQEHSPTYRYYTSTNKNPLAAKFKEHLVEPTLPVNGKHTHETWQSGAGEVHSDLMGKRFLEAQNLQLQGYSMDDAIARLKKLEAEGNDALFKSYLERPDPAINLDAHFKPETTFEQKKQLLQVFPTVAGAIGVGGAAATLMSNPWASNKQQPMGLRQGGPFQTSYYSSDVHDNYYANGGMIKRADGSYSRRGLWDNIRANAGSGKEPTKEMLEQERKINREYAKGGSLGLFKKKNNNTGLLATDIMSGNTINTPITPIVPGNEAFSLPINSSVNTQPIFKINPNPSTAPVDCVDGRCYETDQIQEMYDKADRLPVNVANFEQGIADKLWTNPKTGERRNYIALGQPGQDAREIWREHGINNFIDPSCMYVAGLGWRCAPETKNYLQNFDPVYFNSNSRFINAVDKGIVPFTRTETYSDPSFDKPEKGNLQVGDIVNFKGADNSHAMTFMGYDPKGKSQWFDSNGSAAHMGVHGVWDELMPNNTGKGSDYAYVNRFDSQKYVNDTYGKEIQALEEKARTNPTYIQEAISAEPVPSTSTVPVTTESGTGVFRTGGSLPKPYSLPEDSFRQGGNNLHNSIYASTPGQYPQPYRNGGSLVANSSMPMAEPMRSNVIPASAFEAPVNFNPEVYADIEKSDGTTYKQAVDGKWYISGPRAKDYTLMHDPAGIWADSLKEGIRQAKIVPTSQIPIQDNSRKV